LNQRKWQSNLQKTRAQPSGKRLDYLMSLTRMIAISFRLISYLIDLLAISTALQFLFLQQICKRLHTTRMRVLTSLS